MAASNANTKTDAMTATTIITVLDTPPFEGPGLEVISGPGLELGLRPEPGPDPAVDVGCEPPEPVVLPTTLPCDPGDVALRFEEV